MLPNLFYRPFFGLLVNQTEYQGSGRMFNLYGGEVIKLRPKNAENRNVPSRSNHTEEASATPSGEGGRNIKLVLGRKWYLWRIVPGKGSL
jgi:hypothetical protein